LTGVVTGVLTGGITGYLAAVELSGELLHDALIELSKPVREMLGLKKLQ
jgi:hypothetical protein